MRLRFVETMRGALACPSEAGEVERPAEFTISVDAPRARVLALGGSLPARGVVRAPPLCVEAPCEGELQVSLVPPRVGYRLSFSSDDGRALVLEGAKQVDPTRPLATMTHLPVRVVDGGGADVARGYVRFALSDLPSFLVTFLPFVRAPRRDVDAARLSLLRRRLET